MIMKYSIKLLKEEHKRVLLTHKNQQRGEKTTQAYYYLRFFSHMWKKFQGNATIIHVFYGYAEKNSETTLMKVCRNYTLSR